MTNTLAEIPAHGIPLLKRIRSQAIQRWDLDGRPGDVATYAIRIAIEEAAKVAEEKVAYSTGQAVIRESIAAAIREMIKP